MFVLFLAMLMHSLAVATIGNRYYIRVYTDTGTGILNSQQWYTHNLMHRVCAETAADKCSVKNEKKNIERKYICSALKLCFFLFFLIIDLQIRQKLVCCSCGINISIHTKIFRDFLISSVAVAWQFRRQQKVAPHSALYYDTIILFLFPHFHSVSSYQRSCRRSLCIAGPTNHEARWQCKDDTDKNTTSNNTCRRRKKERNADEVAKEYVDGWSLCRFVDLWCPDRSID